jgi:hypothetical protein
VSTLATSIETSIFDFEMSSSPISRVPYLCLLTALIAFRQLVTPAASLNDESYVRREIHDALLYALGRPT